MPRSLADAARIDEVLTRLERLTPETTRRWGKMNANEMVCHLADSFRGVMGERPVSTVPASELQRNIMRFVALRVPLRWPHGIQTRPEVDPKRTGTRPAEFEADRRDLIALMRRFLSDAAVVKHHPMFGAMTREDWLIWGYRHMDHHLRQFGL